MPLLSQDDFEFLRAEVPSTCSACKREVRKNYCRTCDEHYMSGHAVDCSHYSHVGHRTYDLTQICEIRARVNNLYSSEMDAYYRKVKDYHDTNALNTPILIASFLLYCIDNFPDPDKKWFSPEELSGVSGLGVSIIENSVAAYSYLFGRASGNLISKARNGTIDISTSERGSLVISAQQRKQPAQVGRTFTLPKAYQKRSSQVECDKNYEPGVVGREDKYGKTNKPADHIVVDKIIVDYYPGDFEKDFTLLNSVIDAANKLTQASAELCDQIPEGA